MVGIGSMARFSARRLLTVVPAGPLAALVVSCGNPTGPGAGVEVHTSLGRIEVGYYKSCFARLSGEVWCWGSGDGGLGPRLELDSDFLTISLGSEVTCGLEAEGRAFCWGENRYGEVGDGSTLPRDAPTPVATDARFSRVSAADDHVCALRGNGRAYCWGRNALGGLGNGKIGEEENESKPDPDAGGISFEVIDGRGRHCGLDTSGRAFCWGSVSGSFDPSAYRAPGNCSEHYYQWYYGRPCAEPTPVSGGHVFSSISTGGHSDCALDPTGRAFCWGAGQYGTLGDGSFGPGTYAVAPVPVAGGETFSEVAAGATHVCALTLEGIPYCWGNNFTGQLGDGSREPGGDEGVLLSPVPVQVTGGHRFIQIASGSYHSCALTDAREIWCWGSNVVGQLGRDFVQDFSSVPVRVELLQP
jgi:alpha-tubulin suppressor-like RCC1 family protein